MHSSPASHRGTRFSGSQQGVSIPPRRSTQPHPPKVTLHFYERQEVNYEHSRIPHFILSLHLSHLILFQSSPTKQNSRPRCHWCPKAYPSGSLYSLCSVLSNAGMDCRDMSSKLSCSADSIRFCPINSPGVSRL